MPFIVNGCGTAVIKGRGDVGWGSFDAVEWIVIFFAPIIPIRPVHTFGWSGKTYRQIPIRWSVALLVRSFLRPWHFWLIVVGGFLLLWGAIQAAGDKKPVDFLTIPLMLSSGTLLLASSAILHFALAATDRRTDNVRRILGPHQLGSCDPALMQQPMKPDPREVYGTDCYADAVPGLLDAGRYSRAMWAARLSTAWEDRAFGEELSDQVLRHPGMSEALEVLRRDLNCWAELMLSPAERQARQSQA
jgi:hypothetical protein